MAHTSQGLDYAEWAEVLFEFFHAEAEDGEAIFFHVDDALLNSVADEHGFDDGVTCFLRTVELYTEGFTTLGMRRVGQRSNLWEFDGSVGVPPMLPVLGMTVLAATRMRGDVSGGRRVSPNNYYRWLNKLTGRDLEGGQPEWMGEVRTLWRRWERWLAGSGGQFGRSTLPKAPRQTYVALPISQALWRRSDNLLLRRFLTDQGWAGASVALPDDEDLLRAARTWGRESLHGARQAFFDDDDHAEAVLAILKAAAALPPITRARAAATGAADRGQLRLMVSAPPGRRLSLFAERQARWPSSMRAKSTDGSEYRLEAADGLMYRVEGPLSAAILREGLTLEAEGGHRLSMPGRGEVALQSDPVCGADGSVDELDPDVGFLLVAPSHMGEDMVGHVEQLGARTRPITVEGVPPGWGAWQCKRLHGDLSNTPEWLAQLLPSEVERLEVVGGLRPDSRRSTYLVGHPPRVLRQGYDEVRVNGHVVGKADADGAFDLRSLDIGVGGHVVEVGPARANIRLVDRGLAERRALWGTRGQRWRVVDGRLRWVGVGEGNPGELVIDGAHLPDRLGPDPSVLGYPVSVPITLGSVILGRSGEVANAVRQGAQASWLRRADLISGDRVVRVPFTPMWLLVDTVGGCRVEPIAVCPDPPQLAGPVDVHWAEAILAAARPVRCGEEWDRYVEAAGAAIGGHAYAG